MCLIYFTFMKTKHLWILLIIGIVFKVFLPSACADSTEGLIRRAINASTSLANGNYTAAAGQAIPGKNFGQGQTSVHVNPTSVGVHQGVPGLPQVGNKYVNLNSGFNAYGHINSKGQPTVRRNFQVQTGSRHVRNTTTFE